jgi:hypothetical protein
MACAICEIRRPKRYCPGVRGDICPICCGTEREETVACPLDCEYLLEARKREPSALTSIEQVPNRDIRVTEQFVEEHSGLLVFLGQTIAAASLTGEGVVDSDVREALAALIQTFRTLQSGVYYETVPANPLAVRVYGAVQEALARFKEEEQKRFGMARTRDAEALGLLVFLQRLEFDRNNGRKKGRAFIQFLTSYYPDEPEVPAAEPSSLILP